MAPETLIQIVQMQHDHAVSASQLRRALDARAALERSHTIRGRRWLTAAAARFARRASSTARPRRRDARHALHRAASSG